MVRPCGRGSTEAFGKAFKIGNNIVLAADSNVLLRPPSLPDDSAQPHRVLGVVFHNTIQNVDIVALDYSLGSITGNVVDTRYAAHRQL